MAHADADSQLCEACDVERGVLLSGDRTGQASEPAPSSGANGIAMGHDEDPTVSAPDKSMVRSITVVHHGPDQAADGSVDTLCVSGNSTTDPGTVSSQTSAPEAASGNEDDPFLTSREEGRAEAGDDGIKRDLDQPRRSGVSGLLIEISQRMSDFFEGRRKKEERLLGKFILAAQVGDTKRLQELLQKYVIREQAEEHDEDGRPLRIPVDGSLANTFTALHVASLNGHLETCMLLLQKGKADPNVPTDFGGTALHFAARNGHDLVCSLLLGIDKDGREYSVPRLEPRADIHAATKKGYTALHWACRNGHTRVVTLLLRGGANPTLCNLYGDTPVHWACRSGHIDTANALLSFHTSADNQIAPTDSPDLANCRGANAMTPILWAALNGQSSIAAILIQNGAAVELTDNDGWNSAHFAARFGHPHVAQEVLANALQLDEETGLSYASILFSNKQDNGLTDATSPDTKESKAEGLSGPAETETSDDLLVVHEGPESVGRELLLMRSVVKSLHKKDKYGHAPLHLSALHGHTATTQVLIRMGADIYDVIENDELAAIEEDDFSDDGRGRSSSQRRTQAAVLASSILLPMLAGDAGAVEDVNFSRIAREGTALDVSLKKGHTETARMLLRAHMLLENMRTPTVGEAQKFCDELTSMASYPGPTQHAAPSELSSIAQRYLDDETYVIREEDIDFTNLRMIGRGSYGHVYQATWTSSHVALKVLNLQQPNGDGDVGLLTRNEAAMMASMRHPHIVLFLGSCIRSNGQLVLVSEFMEGGTLHNLLHRNPREIRTKIRVKIAAQIASGLQYLHSRSPPVIHRDLSSNNILLDRSLTFPKISDFGLSRIKSESTQNNSRSCGTAFYQPPEVFLGPCIDECVDNYAFGVLLWEILTRTRPWNPLPPERVMYQLIMHGTEATRSHLEIPTGNPTQLTQLMIECWSHDPDDRPTSNRIAEVMERAVATAKRTETAGAQ